MISFSRYYFFVLFLFFVSGPVYSIELPDFTELAEEYSPSVVNILSEKEFKEIDQRVNLLYNALEGSSLRIFPVIDDENSRWISPSENRTKANFIRDTLYSNFINTGFKTYLYFLNEGKRTKDFNESDKILNAIFETQNRYGSGKCKLCKMQ